MPLAPIALFAYNRPSHTRATVESLLRNPEARESRLHVFCDGARTGQAQASIAEVRSYVRSISGFRSIEVVCRDRNLGLAASVIDGVTRVCGEAGTIIVVEDDLVVAPAFLRYLNAALDRYRDDERVMQISAHMFPVQVETAHDALFLPFVSSWGWATWQRAWQKFDPGAGGHERLKSDRELRRAFDLGGSYDYSSMLDAQMKGKIDSWAIRWNWTVFRNQGLVLYPAKSLVENKGFDGSGVHTRGGAPEGLVDAGFVPERLPPVAPNPGSEAAVQRYFRARRGVASRLRGIVRRVLA